MTGTEREETGEGEKIGPDWQTGLNIREAMFIATKIYKIRHNSGNSVKYTLKSIMYNHICHLNIIR